MRRGLAIAMMCGGLAACSLPSPFEPLVPVVPDVPGNLATDRRACDHAYPPHPGGYVAHAQCVNAAVERDAIPYARYPDLVRMQEQLRLKYSAQIDRGAISPHDGERKMAEADALVDSATRERDRGRPMVADRRVDRLQTLLQ